MPGMGIFMMEMFALEEELRDSSYVMATYYIETGQGEDIVKKARAFAIGQTLGTWVDVPYISQDMADRHMAKIIDITEAPPWDLKYSAEDKKKYFIKLAFPAVNFSDNLTMLITALLGNDASTSSQAKLVNLLLPKQYVGNFKGPKYGIQGLRELTGVWDRPILLNMIKPCTGITPEIGAKIFYETALGKVDIIKDDELLGNTSFSPLKNRIQEYRKAAENAWKVTGKRTLYAVNITDRADRMPENAKIARDYGADAIMINYAAVGYCMMNYISGLVDLPVLGHYAGSGMWSESCCSGMGSHLVNGLLPRLTGADIAIINTPYGKYPLNHPSYIKTVQRLTCEYYGIKKTAPAVGGGVHPGVVKTFVDELGKDIVLAAGGAVHGHPNGAAAGVGAMLGAIEAAVAGIDIKVAAEENQDLKLACEFWNR